MRELVHAVNQFLGGGFFKPDHFDPLAAFHHDLENVQEVTVTAAQHDHIEVIDQTHDVGAHAHVPVALPDGLTRFSGVMNMQSHTFDLVTQGRELVDEGPGAGVALAFDHIRNRPQQFAVFTDAVAQQAFKIDGALIVIPSRVVQILRVNKHAHVRADSHEL